MPYSPPDVSLLVLHVTRGARCTGDDDFDGTSGHFLPAPPPSSARSPPSVSDVGERENANTVITAVFVFISDCTCRRRPYRAAMRSPSPTYIFRMIVCGDADSLPTRWLVYNRTAFVSPRIIPHPSFSSVHSFVY
ncbi:hypothetical protein GALMADRAFT_1121205 [Galerina marginata CBS 339.88]|uniref:Uncharacterized protein n=1 Tax=Galerina marginata (strain CBS 339.88) TaxID=685588 RepID=A0A067TQ11_GALM3|nr:hypothetical protein GALMADRAFT_1121205 [Galerina marginata CBS 339.88]